MDRLVDLLGDMNKIRMVLVLEREGTLKKTDLYSKIKANNANAAKLEELKTEGLIVMTTDTFANNITMVSLTLEGRAVARKLLEIEGILSGELAASGAEMDYEPSPTQRDSVS